MPAPILISGTYALIPHPEQAYFNSAQLAHPAGNKTIVSRKGTWTGAVDRIELVIVNGLSTFFGTELVVVGIIKA